MPRLEFRVHAATLPQQPLNLNHTAEFSSRQLEEVATQLPTYLGISLNMDGFGGPFEKGAAYHFGT